MAFVQPGGTSMFYADDGEGEPSLVFAHGLMNDHTYFAPQIDHFRSSFRTVAVDLPGHGQSDRPERQYTIGGFADDLSLLIDELDLHRPVVIGHSMGGAAALQLAADSPSRLGAVVILDSPVIPPPDFQAAVQQFAEGARGPDYSEVVRQFMGQFVGFQDDPGRAEELVEQMASTPQHVTAPCLQSYVDWDSEAAASVSVPVLYVSSGPWFTQVDRFRELSPQLVTGQTVGSGHYHQLEVPDQINSMLRRFLEVEVGLPA